MRNLLEFSHCENPFTMNTSVQLFRVDIAWFFA
jgi:hypothetical protein